MKIPVLHPELYMGTRGDKSPRMIVKALMTGTHDLEFDAYIREAYEMAGVHEDDLEYQSKLLWPQIKQSKKIYAIGKHFFAAISSVQNDLPVEILPDAFSAYIACPHQEELIHHDTMLKTDDPIVGFYVSFLMESESTARISIHTHIADRSPSNKTTLDAAPVSGSVIWSKLNINNGKVLIDVTVLNHAVSERLVYTALNLIAYINSSQPDISWMKPKPGTSTKERKEARARGHVFSNDLTVPVRLVSWGWQKPKQYTTQEWKRKMHLRWQRFGPNLSQVKLIWIEETVVKRKIEGD